MRPHKLIAAQHEHVKQRNASIIRCRALGLGDATIAHIFDVTRQTIHRIAGPRMAPTPKPDPPPEAAASNLATLPERMRAWRQAKGWTQSEAARELGVNSITLCRWENGRASCSFAPMVLKFIEMHGKTAGASEASHLVRSSEHVKGN